MTNSKINFLGFNILKSNFEIIKPIHNDVSLSVGFTPSGEIIKEEKKFILKLSVSITNECINIKIDSVAHFDITDIGENYSFLYLNAPALLFPYLRAYISTLTNLSGIEPITLPTLNLTSLKEELEQNTKTF